jgi:NADH-quinone oxidoreductase subunit M
LALIPVYFLCSIWGGEKRIKVTFKFFIYTFLGSLFMLAGIIYLYTFNPSKSFDIASMISAGQALSSCTQQVLFWAFFIAFAVKMPIFPFHTWQPDTYEQSATPTTIVLSALMVKMGLFATVKWVLPIFPEGVAFWTNTVIILSLIGLIYASLLATIQTNIKRLVAYSSIAHIALMNVGIFADTTIALNGLIVQMFNHGINIAGLWLIVDMIEKRYGTTNMKQLGGMANDAPWLTIALVIIAFANISLPLTNAFVGEFMLFHGIFESVNPHHISYMAIAGLGVIWGAVYMLNMVQNVAYGDKKTEGIADVTTNEWIPLVGVIVLIIVLGIYPDFIYRFLPV